MNDERVSLTSESAAPVAQQGMSYIVTSHNIGLIRYVCARVIVMRYGEMAEEDHAGQVFDHPAHRYTGQLLAAVPARVTGFGRPRSR